MIRKTAHKPTPHALQSKSGRLNKGGSTVLLKKGKQPTVSALKKKCWAVFSLYIRMRDCLKTTGCKDWGLCITCGKRYHIKLLQSGHFISGRHNANLFSEKGVHAQCYNCNINLRGNPLEYRRQIIKMYGEGTDLELEEEARQIKKFLPRDLTNLIECYKIKIKDMEAYDGNLG